MLIKNFLDFFILTILFVTVVSAACSEGQIDINTASAEELDDIMWVGNATAHKIIANRPFNSVDELTKVSGIGEVKLSDIKEQGLACVADNEENSSETIEENSSEKEKPATETEKTEVKETPYETRSSSVNQITEEETKIIKLNPQVIKIEENTELSDNYAVYGFVAVSILVVVLFLLKRRRYKTEFE